MPYKNTELIKWVAFFLMAGDHINKYVLNEASTLLYCAGRIAMPLFCYCLAYNLARPDTLIGGVYSRTAIRIFIFGVIATPAYIILGGVIDDWWPLNILFTLFGICVICYCLDMGRRNYTFLAYLVFLILGAVVEFWWPAIAMGVSIWLFYKEGRGMYLFLALLSCALLALINDNFYALLAVPVISLASVLRFSLPRFKWMFYAFYPVHLYLILALRSYLMSKGYLFFT